MTILETPETVRSYIHGEYVASTANQVFENINPATGKLICHVETAGQPEVDKAVASAEDGQRVWQTMGPQARSLTLQRAAQLLRQGNTALAELEVADTGKPISEAISVDILSGAEALDYYAQLAIGLDGEHRSGAGHFSYTKNVPLGVCAAIGAWNYPLQIACWKAAPALAAGNALIFKPSELSPSTAPKLAEILIEAGLPPGVFNVVQGKKETGALLAEHEKIQKISLTGSVATGKKVLASSAASLKQATMELGGKSPIIVFADAAMDEAVSGVMLGNFYTQGEVCSNGTRVYVEKTVYKEFLSKLTERTQRLEVGDPMKASTQVGALISRSHAEKVRRYIEQGKEEGAQLILGGDDPQVTGRCAEGFFVNPTIFADCGDQMTISREEIFGPVVCVLSFETEDEAVARANNSPFGLASGVFTKDLKKAHRVADQIETGVCWVNNYNVTPTGMPFGGFKQSGIGRENGPSTLKSYTQEKTVYVELDKIDCPYQ